MNKYRKHIEIRGIVQGVGFRPFVYRLATELGLAGFVFNHSEGVTVEIEGSAEQVGAFVPKLHSEAPPLSQIGSVSILELEPAGSLGFAIRRSRSEPEKFALVPADVGTCADCLRDFTDSRNRRFGYPFTNCTNCGPRYTIIQDIPYDRPATTMAEFQMCVKCQAEYGDPLNRRFDAQPNACPVCGPSVSLPLSEVRRLLREGKVLAIKGLGGFHLACDARNETAVRTLRERKRRSDKAFALMIREMSLIEEFCEVSETDRALLASPQRPIVLLPRRPGSPVPEAVAPGNRLLGVMLPYTPLHYLLFEDRLDALVMTSGNLSEEPIVSQNEEAPSRLGPIADGFVFHNRRIQTRVDDSVVRTFEDVPRLIRRSRGYAPQPIDLGRPVQDILAAGGELKNTFCLTKGHYAILSQHIGDLENIETLAFFRETLEHMRRFFRVTPRAVAYDLHPGYLSTKLALEMDGIEHIGVQHHHAHVASCMAENGLSGRVIGVAFDGTGYGTDGRIWGGEFLIAGYRGFKRAAHLRYVPLPGGDRAVRQPWRVALSYLIDAGYRDWLGRGAAPAQLGIVRKMIEQRINTVQTSSCGRLFDAVASLIGLRQETNYEGQAAIELEMIAGEGIDDAYPFQLEGRDPIQIDMRPAIVAILRDIRQGTANAIISARFHNTAGDMIVEVCRRLRDHEGLGRVCLSGGTFQNFHLLERCLPGLRRSGFEVYLQAKVPANDGGLSLGQALIANEVFT